MIEMVRSGTTCFVSPNADPRDDYAALSAVVGEIGIRAVFCRFIMARDNDFSAAGAIQNTLNPIDRPTCNSNSSSASFCRRSSSCVVIR